MKIVKWIIILIVVILIVAIASTVYFNWKMNTWPDSTARFNVDYPEEGIRVACVGDSITEGGSAVIVKKYSYPAQLSNLLGEEYVVGNFGVSGATALTEGDRPYTELNAFEFSKDFNPDIVLIMLGTNDSKGYNWNRESYKSDYKELIQTYTSLASSPRVIVVTPITAYSTEYDIQPNVIENEILVIVQEICNELGIECIDLNRQFPKNEELLINDGIHPNKDGYEHIADILFDIIEWE